MRKENMGRANMTCKLYSRTSSSIKLISATDGTITKFQKPVRAAELMLDNPGWFICDSAELSVGLRVPGLTADEKLLPSRLYFLLPVDMLYSVLTEEEMDSLSRKASIAFKKRGYKREIGKKEKKKKMVRIIPALSDFCLFPGGAECIKECARDAETLEIVQRYRPWRPALDTILEVC
ncbi:hypothetical protein LUZ63_016261 [Rhynchospora breviuscula]|uniref:Uncharacterized protein n=1 Tax=Rhynchospora breviuscula TaxID=2022672 RepID=A0A9P9Z9J0_9POAL|nr:hypothetical protein LUZ63_016261 [Rhynchospora breviuscula]